MKSATLGAIALAVLVYAFPAGAQVNSLPSQPHLLVKGQAERKVAPDRFTVTVSLRRADPSPSRARELVQADAQVVLAAFEDHNALEESVRATSLAISPNMAMEDNRQVFKGTQVSRLLVASFDSLASVRGFLGSLQTSEFLTLSGIAPAFSEEPALRAELKRAAALQSRESAEGLAEAYGSRITGLYTISDVAPGFAYGVQAGSWPRQSGVAEPPPAPVADVGAVVTSPRPMDAYIRAESLEAGTLTISENVYAIFLISP